MPPQRKLHKRALAGDRTNALSNLEWRVWTAYEMAADDFGVLRYHEEAWITAHPYFSREKPRAVRAAIDAVVKSTLIRSFTAPNGLTYVFQHDWQDWQRIDWPSLTTAPKVPDGLLAECTALTRRLFSVWPGGKRLKGFKGELTDELPASEPEVPGKYSAGFPNLLSGVPDATREYSYSFSSSQEGSGDWFWSEWRRVMAARVSLPVMPKAGDIPTIVAICESVPNRAVLAAALVRFEAMPEPERKTRGIKALTLGFFKMALPDLVVAPATTRARCQHNHQPPCADDASCTERYLAELHRVPA